MKTCDTPPVEQAAPSAAASEAFDCLEALWRESEQHLKWDSPFTLPGWIGEWRHAFAPAAAPWIVSVRDRGRLIGVAPLLRDAESVRFIGSTDVCDHLDLVTSPEHGAEFCDTLLEMLRQEGIRRLDLGHLRPDSAVMTCLVPRARLRRYPVELSQEELLFELGLPASWESYLERLDGKQRHEIRRKLRRLGQNAAFAFRLVLDPAGVAAAMDQFLELFRRNRPAKAAFMSAGMEGFFRSLAGRLPETRIGFLDVDARPAAAVMCFDHRHTRYLYNSGFDPAFSHLSVGILCKVLSIRDAIARGLKTYDFLKGNEAYKVRLGGRPVALYRCRIDLTR
ncbi:MAG: GNAT family N-acetyltransferase [Desulfobacterales bacterium]|jgi:CelD/BcsL family acetyltransferase involved in cellulose biosynthesis|nr:GNAT family N-acetyltransferase [Desulfobacterales bacterium]